MHRRSSGSLAKLAGTLCILVNRTLLVGHSQWLGPTTHNSGGAQAHTAPFGFRPLVTVYHWQFLNVAEPIIYLIVCKTDVIVKLHLINPLTLHNFDVLVVCQL